MTPTEAHAMIRDGFGGLIDADDLNQMLADVWDEGEKSGYIGGQHDAHRWDPDEDNYEDPPNPYRATETA